MSASASGQPFSILVDPYIFVTPVADSREGWMRLFDRLMTWGGVLRRDDAVTSQRAVTAIREADRYPTYAMVKHAVSVHGVVIYSLLDIQNALRALADREPYAEARIPITEVVAATVVTPETLTARLPTAAGTALADVLVSVALSNNLEATPLPVVATADVETEPSVLATTVRVTASVSMFASGADVFGEASVDSELKLAQSPGALTPPPDWANVCDSPSAAFAYCLAEMQASDSSLTCTLSIRVGDGFCATVAACGLAGQPAVLQKLYRYAVMAAAGRLQHVPAAKRHPVRETAAAEAPQVTRAGGEKKWRCMLTKTGAGYRLQYWDCADGIVELDSVVVESDV